MQEDYGDGLFPAPHMKPQTQTLAGDPSLSSQHSWLPGPLVAGYGFRFGDSVLRFRVRGFVVLHYAFQYFCAACGLTVVQCSSSLNKKVKRVTVFMA